MRRIAELIGYRGSVLLFLALWSGGQAVRLGWADAEAASSPTLAYLASIAPLGVMAVPWAVCAVLCIVQAFTITDWHAFALAAGLLVAWAVLYLAGGLQGVIPEAYWACIVQITVAALILRLSRWPDPPRAT